ncbi:general substrate transporter, partial [Dichotomocladium elegans]
HIKILLIRMTLDQSEIAPKEMRGRIVSIQQFAITLGICAAYWVDYGVLDLKGSSSWRLALGLPLIPAFIYLAITFGLPRSPRYLVYKHNDQKALESLAVTRGDGSTNHPDVLMEYIEIKQSIRFEEKYGSKHYCRLFQKGPENNLKRLILGMAAQIFQQLTGASTLFLYAPGLFQASGIKGRHSALLANGISGVINLIFTIPPMIYIDHWGRRPTLIAGSIFCCACTVVMTVIASVTGLADAVLTTLANDEINSVEEGEPLAYTSPNNASIGFLVMMYLFIACYAMTWGPAGWIYPTELYSQDIRAQALGLTTAANWLFNFGVTQLSPLMFLSIHWKTFVIYAVLCAVSSYVVYKYFPETMGKSLEEIDLIFSGNFNFYDLNVHHPQTAAAALSQLDRIRARNPTVIGVEQLFLST